MDEDIQRSVRNLGRGFHAGQFSTRQLLEIMQISKVYIASGLIHGFFFSPAEVVTAMKHYQETGYLITKEMLEGIEQWAATEQIRVSTGLSSSDISLPCQEASHWVPPEDSGKSDLDITVIDLKHLTPTCCADRKSVTQLRGSVTLNGCPNVLCNASPCIQHIITCHKCETDLCPSCVATFVNEHGVSVDAFGEERTYAMCETCHPNCSFEDPCSKCLDLLGDTDA